MSCHDYHSAERIQRTKNVIQALWFAKNDLSSAVMQETGEALDEVLSGILPAILMALAIVAGCTLVGLSLGALGGAVAGVGVGDVPGVIAGSSTGFTAGLWILEWMGLAFLAVHVGKNMYQVTRLVESGFNDAWGTGARNVLV
jgi:phage tail tape-measure protein